MLGDLGADVIKVEEPKRGDFYRSLPPFIRGESYYFMGVNRNKRSLTLDIHREEGKEILLRLTRQADILVENFRPGALEQLGLGYESVKKINPTIIYCSITGYGRTGPLSRKSAYDLIIQGLTGMMMISGDPKGSPVKIAPAVPDVATGMVAAFSILGALFYRERTKVGQFIDTSLHDAAFFTLTLVYLPYYFGTGLQPGPLGTAHPVIVPMQAFAARDGKYVTTGAFTDEMWAALAHVLGLDRLQKDPKFATSPARLENRRELESHLHKAFASRTSKEWMKLLDKAGLPCGPVHNLAEAVMNPQVRAREMVIEMAHSKAGTIKMVGVPWKMTETPASVLRPPPFLGEHTEEILVKLGYSVSDIRRLRQEGII